MYLDDIIVFSETVEQHLERLVTVLGRLCSAGLKLKPKKCALFQKSIAFLGHVVSERGIETDPVKTEAVREWPVPRSVRDVRAFLGLAGYYRRFVPGFASIAGPLHAMLGKGRKFQWTPEAQQSFDSLKLALTSSPILAMPTDEGEFILDTDSSDSTIGAVLSQVQEGHERVVAYASRRLDRREIRYCVTRKELQYIVHFVHYFRQYLLGREFRIRTDHSALTLLRRSPDPIGQQARWLEILEEFNFSIEHRPGARHENADAMSRCFCKIRDCACRHGLEKDLHNECQTNSGGVESKSARRKVSGQDVANSDRQLRRHAPANVIGGAADQPLANVSSHGNDEAEKQQDNVVASGASEDNELSVFQWSLDGIRKEQQADPDIKCVIDWLQASNVKPPWETVALASHNVKTLWAQWPRLDIKEGLLRRRFESPDGLSVHWQVIWPSSLKTEFLKLAHGGMTGGHFGRKRTAAVIQSRVYWPSWSSDLDIFLRQCEPCARYHRGSIPRHGRLCPLVVGNLGKGFRLISRVLPAKSIYSHLRLPFF